MDKLIFLADKLQNPDKLRDFRLPAHFIEPGILKNAKMYKAKGHSNYDDVFIAKDTLNTSKGNKVVYGSLFLCSYWEVYRNVLDAYYGCSLSNLGVNHDRDYSHRVTEKITPISFETLDDLVHLNYMEKKEVLCECYLGNPNHPDIAKKVNNPKHTHHKIKSNIHLGFKQLYEEVGKL